MTPEELAAENEALKSQLDAAQKRIRKNNAENKSLRSRLKSGEPPAEPPADDPAEAKTGQPFRGRAYLGVSDEDHETPSEALALVLAKAGILADHLDTAHEKLRPLASFDENDELGFEIDGEWVPADAETIAALIPKQMLRPKGGGGSGSGSPKPVAIAAKPDPTLPKEVMSQSAFEKAQTAEGSRGLHVRVQKEVLK